MRESQRQRHMKSNCKYPVVFVSKYCRRSFYGALRQRIGGILLKIRLKKQGSARCL